MNPFEDSSFQKKKKKMEVLQNANGCMNLYVMCFSVISLVLKSTTQVSLTINSRQLRRHIYIKSRFSLDMEIPNTSNWPPYRIHCNISSKCCIYFL